MQVGVEGPQLVDQEHALVDHGATGQGDHVGVPAQMLEYPPGYIELSVKIQAGSRFLRPGHKSLEDARHFVPGSLAQNLRVHGHLPPAQESHAFLLGHQFELSLGLPAFQTIPRQEEHAHAVVPPSGQGDARLRRRPGKKRVGDLGEYAHPVAGLTLGILARPVLQLLHDLQGIVHCLMTGPALYVHHGANAAGVMLEFRAVQPSPFSRFFPHASRLFP